MRNKFPQERLTIHTHQTYGEPEVILAHNEYDNLGQLRQKAVGISQSSEGVPLQIINYQYNIRGWLTDINDVDELTQFENLGAISEDLFAFRIEYDSPLNTHNNVTPLYNGNISETYWRTAKDNTLRSYGYQYDDLNRLLDGFYRKPELSIPDTHSYNEHLQYDKNGNITNLARKGGFDSPDMSEEIDVLEYNYDQGNQLLSVSDFTNSPQGFVDGNQNSDDYNYDANGNMIVDLNKKIDRIHYNHLNLPQRIEFMDGNKIEYTYTASGTKLSKKVIGNEQVEQTDYLSGYQYLNDKLMFFPTAEGYVNYANISELQDMNHAKFSYVYNYTDHLGNVRLSYTQNPQNPNQLTILEENNYYPFGLKHNNYNKEIKEIKLEEYTGIQGSEIAGEGQHGLTLVPALENEYQYKYQGQERQNELNLNWDSFKWRNYDYAIGRFMSIDPLSEKYSYQSHYNFSENRVIDGVELEGLEWIWFSTAENAKNFKTANGLTPSSLIYPTGRIDYSIPWNMNTWFGTYSAGDIPLDKAYILHLGFKEMMFSSLSALNEYAQGVDWEHFYETNEVFSNSSSSYVMTTNEWWNQYDGWQSLGELSCTLCGVLASVKVSSFNSSSKIKQVKKAYKKAGYELVEGTTSTYKIPSKEAKSGYFYSRIQRGNPNGNKYTSRDRVVNTKGDGDPTNKQYVHPNGAPIKNKTISEQKEIGHIYLD